MKMKKKLIEVALPLDAINAASAREKSIRHGHPSTLHLWWARRPLAAGRAVIFSQMVDDPAAVPEEFPTEAEQEAERERLFGILRKLVLWENTGNETVLGKARAEICRSWRRTCADNAGHPRAAELFDPEQLPAFHDPFAGGGALPLEAQRLGLAAHASDLNPVAVLINKAMIEIPPKFAGVPPVNPACRADEKLFGREWQGAQGLAEDVRHYGQWMRDEAEKRIGHLYPKVEVTAEMVRERPDLKPYAGRKLTVIAWLWARTVKSPNPAFADVDVPLASTFMLSTKKGKEAYVEPVIEGRGYRFEVRVGAPADPESTKRGTKLGRGSNFECLLSGSPITGKYIKAESMAGRMHVRLLAVVVEGTRGRVYLNPSTEHEGIAHGAVPSWKPDETMNRDTTNLVSGRGYGFFTWADLFTSRQLVALTTFSDLVGEAMERIRMDAAAAGLPDDDRPLRDEGNGAKAYAEAVGVYLATALSRLSDICNAFCRWEVTKTQVRNLFGRQAIPMMWDFAENNVFGDVAGDYMVSLRSMATALDKMPACGQGLGTQQSAQTQVVGVDKLISTDPPYYDNIGYADLSDFFYVWLRRSLRSIFPDLFATLAVPKAEELVATPYRHGSKDRAEQFFLDGMTQAMQRLATQAHPGFPVTIYYAFKQSERKGEGGEASTGWETFLDAVIRSGFAVTGTWPMRTELSNRMVGMGTSALASSIVLVCRRRPADAPPATRREFVAALRKDLARAVVKMQSGNVAPVDLAQAAIGPGMAIYTRYAKVLDAEGQPVSVRDALALINQILDEVLAEQEGAFDADSRWALAWFEQHGFDEGEFGRAETLSKAKNTSVAGLVEAGILAAKAGKVRLLKPDELPDAWEPAADSRLTTWEMVHHLIQILEASGESAAAELVEKLGAEADVARELCYRLYTLCERKKRAAEALSYNGLVQSWPEIMRLARQRRATEAGQTSLMFPE